MVTYMARWTWGALPRCRRSRHADCRTGWQSWATATPRRLAPVLIATALAGHVSTCRARGFVVDQGSDGRVAAQPVQAPSAVGSDAPGRDAQPRADLGIRYRRVCDGQGEQLLAGGGQPGNCVAQSGLLLGHEQVLLDWGGLGVREACGDQDLLARAPPTRGVEHASAFAPCRGGQPARQRSRIAQVIQAGHQREPDGLAYILGVGPLQPVAP